MHIFSPNSHILSGKKASLLEHFPIILAMIRAAAKDGNAAFMKHAERLRSALHESGAVEEAHALELALKSAKREPGSLAPSRVVLSRSSAPGEVITATTNPPVDRETSTPLAEIWPLEKIQLLAPPLLNSELENAVAVLSRQWERADDLIAAGVKVPFSTLFFGPPGTGKTRLAMCAAARVGLPIVLARLDGLTSSFLGTTARNVRTLFDFANRHRCLLLLDEFDGIAKLRDDPHELGEVKRVVNAVLQSIDARAGRGFTVAITNHEKLLDPAVWRRFDARIEVTRPSISTRVEILKRYIAPLPIGNGAIKILAWMTDGYSGSDLETMCDALKRYVILADNPKGSILDAVQLYLRLSADNRTSPRRASLLDNQNGFIAEALLCEELKITQNDAAEIIGQAQSSVSRFVNPKEAKKRG